jgi:hypothetical protein
MNLAMSDPLDLSAIELSNKKRGCMLTYAALRDRLKILFRHVTQPL